MCKLGDIIVIKEFKNEIGEKITRHSFVVISDDKNSIEGMHYDFISNMLCSFHNDEHKNRKLKFKENYEIAKEMIKGNNLNNNSGFIKMDQLYYFDKSLIDYYIIGHINLELLDELIQLILELSKEGKLKYITTNLKETSIV